MNRKITSQPHVPKLERDERMKAAITILLEYILDQQNILQIVMEEKHNTALLSDAYCLSQVSPSSDSSSSGTPGSSKTIN